MNGVLLMVVAAAVLACGYLAMADGWPTSGALTKRPSRRPSA